MNENQLKFEVIWKDSEIIELRISANNGRYSGVTEVYEVSDSLLEFVKELNGFPFGKDRLTHSCGKKDSYAFFEMDFYKIGQSGICGVQITMEENVSTEYRKEEKNKLSMELIVEPNAINNFRKKLKSLAERGEGTAELIGIVKYSNNFI